MRAHKGRFMKRVCTALLVLAVAFAGGCSSEKKDSEGTTTSASVSETTATSAATENADGDKEALAGGASEGKDKDDHETTASETTTETTTVPESQVLGNEKDYTLSYPVKNSTGLSVTAIYIKENSEADFGPENLVDETFLDGETRDAFFKVDNDKEYDIRIIYEDGTTNDITHFSMYDISTAELVFRDGKTIILINGNEPVTPTPEETTSKKKTTKATTDPNDGCIGDDGLFY